MRTYRKLPKGNRSCPTSKLGFKDHKAAVFKVRSLRFSHPDRVYLPVRVYQCPVCGQWHMTSTSEMTSEER